MMIETTKLEELCTIKQACFSEKCGRTTVYKRIKEGHYKACKIGGSTRLLIASLKAYRISFPDGAINAGHSEQGVA